MLTLELLIADFFGEPELVGITCALGANFFVRSLGITHYSLAQRQMNFRARTIAEFADVIVRGTTGIVLAALGFGAWSLVIGYLVGSMSLNIAIWSLVRWRPRLGWDRKHLPRLLRFGGALSAVNLLAAVGNNIDNLFVGHVLGSTALGFYAIAFTIPNLTIVNIAVVAQRVLFPAIASQEPNQMRRSFLITVRYLWLFSLPAAILLFILADPIVFAVFGDQWGEAAAPMRILAVYGFALATSFAAGTVYAAARRPGVLVYLISARLALLVTALFLFTDQGLTAVAACQAVSVATVEAVGLIMASRMLRVRLSLLWAEMWPAIAAGFVMTVPLVVIERSITDPWLTLICGGLVGVAAYVGAVFILAPNAISYLRQRVRRRSTESAIT